MDFLLRIEHLTPLMWVSHGKSIWGYPTILFFHTLGLGAVAGLSAGIDLCLLGFAPKVPSASLRQLYPVVWLAFAISAVSGTILLLADASTKLVNPAFYVKMFFVALAVANLHVLKTRVLLDPLVDTTPISPNAKRLAVTSLFFWIAAITAGRLMAYVK
jgi:hypothetical protein